MRVMLDWRKHLASVCVGSVLTMLAALPIGAQVSTTSTQETMRPLVGNTRNYAHIGKETFRFHCALYYWPPIEMAATTEATKAVSLPIGSVFGEWLPNGLTAGHLRVITLGGVSARHIVTRTADGNTAALAAGARLLASDRLIVALDLTPMDITHCSVLLVLWDNGNDPSTAESSSGYDATLAQIEVTRIADEQNVDAARGLLDFTGPVDRQNPAARIQMDAIFSARWGLWYEFAHWPAQANVNSPAISLVPVPLNPLDRAQNPANNSTLFNMDDVPRFPLYYARYFKATGDASALPYLRAGLQTLIDYTRTDGSMPYLLAPWNEQHREGESVYEIYHSLRAVAEALQVYAQEPAFCAQLEDLYARYRGFVFGHLRDGLFQGRPEATGAVLEGIWIHWMATQAPADLRDIRQLADALSSPQTATRMHQEFGEYIPWVPLGLTAAYSATGEKAYLQAAREWMHQAILPSLLRDRRYYYVVPNFKPSGTNHPWGANPLQIWYHTDALLRLHEATGSEPCRTAAAWVFNDYYDQERYGSVPQWHIVDTEDPWTEHWGAASAEDALRMMAKFLWQWGDTGLYEATRKTRILPEPNVPLF